MTEKTIDIKPEQITQSATEQLLQFTMDLPYDERAVFNRNKFYVDGDTTETVSFEPDSGSRRDQVIGYRIDLHDGNKAIKGWSDSANDEHLLLRMISGSAVLEPRNGEYTCNEQSAQKILDKLARSSDKPLRGMGKIAFRARNLLTR